MISNSTLDATGPLGFGNAAALIESSLGPIDSVAIERSYLNGGAYTLFVRDGGDGMPFNVRLEENVFGPDHAYGYVSSDGPLSLGSNSFGSAHGSTAPDPALLPPVPGGSGDGGADLAGGGVSAGRSTGSVGTTPPTGVFADDDGSPHETDIERIAAAGLTDGCAPGRFCPDRNVTRAEMAVLLVKGLGADPSPLRSFADVDPSAWFAGSVERLRDMGLVKGCAPDRYCPDAIVSRAELAVVLARLRPGGPTRTGSFVDVPAGSWFAPAVRALHGQGLTDGCSADPLQFCPTGPVTRAELASFLSRTFGL